VVATRVAPVLRAGQPVSGERQMLIDFAGGDLQSLHGSQPVRAVVSGLGARIFDVKTERLAENGHWRVRFRVQPAGGRPVDLRCYLELYGAPLSETWTYQWTPGS
jgi:glucans biosynthesis protein